MALGVGAVALGAGIVLGLGAQSKFDYYKQTAVDDDVDADRANSAFDSAESQGRFATVLIPAGAVVLALGATLLVIDLSSGGESNASVGLGPVPGGAILALHGSTEGL